MNIEKAPHDGLLIAAGGDKITLSRFHRLSQAAQPVGLNFHLAGKGILTQAVDVLVVGGRGRYPAT
jgi:hypothetical protein